MSISKTFGPSSKAIPSPARPRRAPARGQRSPANSAASLVLLIALLWAPGAALAEPVLPQGPNAGDLVTLHDRCVAFVQANPAEGLKRAQLWAKQGGGFYAEHCVAMALFNLRRYAEAAEHFESVATATMAVPTTERAQILDQAGQSWLDAGRPDRAKAVFDAAIRLDGTDAELHIDRAEAFDALKQYWDALDDLNRAIDLAPDHPEAYFYRGTTYRKLNTLDLALQDVEHGLELAPDAPIGLLERGNIRRLKGDIAGARRDWLRVEKLAANTPEGKAARVDLNQLKAKDAADKPPAMAK
jgi:tetratricopeptide (TPR) repeat protein